MTYYEIVFGSGLAWCNRYVMKTETPTTDYGALVDTLIDHLVEKGHNCILNRDEYSWDEGGNLRDEDGEIIYSDMYVVGGNCGDVLMHYGEFRINEISESEIRNDEVIEV